MIENQELEKGEHKYNTLTQTTFGFHLASRLECSECERVSWRSDFSLDVPIELTKVSNKKLTLPVGPIPEEEIKEEGLFYPDCKLTDSFIDNFFAP